jgi:hypothetical protein
MSIFLFSINQNMRDNFVDAISFVINMFALYGLIVLVLKYYSLPYNINFDMVAISMLVLKFVKIIIFSRK